MSEEKQRSFEDLVKLKEISIPVELQEKIEIAVQEISEHHREILNDWCKAYCAELYEKNGSIKPGDFILHQQITPQGWKYWLTEKEDE